MAHTEAPAPADRMAVLLARLFPGRLSMMDCAFFLGSSAGTLDAYRALEIEVKVGKERIGRVVGRSLLAPINRNLVSRCCLHSHCQLISPRRKKGCRLCSTLRTGHTPRQSGRHWILKLVYINACRGTETGYTWAQRSDRDVLFNVLPRT